MSFSNQDHSDFDPLLRDAISWVILIRSGSATLADRSSLQEWRDLSPRHDEAFREAVHLWRRFGEQLAMVKASEGQELRGSPPRNRGAAANGGPQSPPNLNLRRRRLDRRFILAGGGAIAASIACYSAIEPPAGLWPSLVELSADYRTAKGEQRKVVVTEGVTVTLNTETSISRKKLPAGEAIDLISGEAWIDSSAYDAKPFEIEAMSGRILATHAKLNARCIDGLVSIACAEGSVRIEFKGRTIELGKGLAVSYSDQIGIGETKETDVSETAAWQEGLLVVRDRPLAAVVDEINRYRFGKIVVINQNLGKRRITGTFRLDQLDEFTGQVRGLFGATVRSLPGGIVILS